MLDRNISEDLYNNNWRLLAHNKQVLLNGDHSRGFNTFEHRFKTKLSAILDASNDHDIQDHSGNHSISDTSSVDSGNLSSQTIHWTTLQRVSSVIFNSNFKSKYGSVSTFCLLTDFILFGTKKGYAVIFDYLQNLKGVLGEDSKTIRVSGAVTSLAISLDSTYIAVGHQNGHIFLWDITNLASINSINPILVISPLTINDKVNGKEGHLLNKPITHLFFLNKRHTAIISTDVDGLVLFHDGYRNFLGYRYTTHKILGSSDLDFTLAKDIHSSLLNKQKALNNSQEFIVKKEKNFVYSCAPLPLSQNQSKGDDLNLFAAITSSALLVIALYPKPTTHIRVGMPKQVKSNPDLTKTACLSWYPGFSQKQTVGPRLAYCFSNVITILELVSAQVSEEDTLGVEIASKKRFVGDECVISLVWLSSKIILGLTISSRILVFDTGLVKFKLNESKDLRLIMSVDAISNHIVYNNHLHDLVPINENLPNENALTDTISLFNSFEYTFKAFKKHVFMLTNNNKFMMGSIVNWEHHIMALVDYGKKNQNMACLITALETCFRIYVGDYDLVRYNLTEQDTVRHKIVHDQLVGLVFFSLKFWFSSYRSEDELAMKELEELVSTIFITAKAMNVGPEFYESIYEFFENHLSAQKIFFETLESFIFKEQIKELTPKVLKNLIIFFSSNINNKRPNLDRLEQMICLLNIKEMDLDLVISLCEKYKLIDSKIFIWNLLLKDYASPLMDFLMMIKKIVYNKSYYKEEDLEVMTDHSYKVYSYLTYILTNRQYPLEIPIEAAELKEVKLNLYFILFHGSSIEWPEKSGEVFFATDNPIGEPSFPYLYLLLVYDTQKTLLMLNEVLEDDFLNEDSGRGSDFKINRQYIIEVLMDIFKENSQVFGLKSKIHLSVLILLNYPKFSQFIRISDSSLDSLIETICDINQLEEEDSTLRNDCELSLQSLLSVYHPTNLNDELIFYFEKNGFYNLLFNLYKIEKNSIKLFQLWANHKKGLNEKYANFEIVELCFELLEYDRQNFEDLVKQNFASLVDEGNFHELISSFIHHAPELNKEILRYHNPQQQYEYLTLFFDLNGLSVDDAFIYTYIELLCKFNSRETVCFLQSLKKNFFKEQNIVQLLDILKQYNNIDSIIYLTKVENNPTKTIDEILSFLGSNLQVTDEFDISLLEKTIWKYLTIATEKCKTVTEEDINEGEILWIKLISFINRLIKDNEKLLLQENKKGTQSIVDLLKRVLQEIFISLINTNFQEKDTNSKDPKSFSNVFFKIFNQFLEQPHTVGENNPETNIGDIKEIIEEIFFLNLYQRQSLKITLTLYNQEVNKNLEIIEKENSKGVTMNSTECTCCGKKIWGRKISNKIFQNWEDFNRRKAQFLVSKNKELDSSIYINNFEYKDSLWEELNVVIFKCGHGYHFQCVKNLGATEDNLKCIICENNSTS